MGFRHESTRRLTGSHYERLGVPAGSTQEQIRLAYLRMARANHPDTRDQQDPAGAGESQRAMVAINAAWFVLGDPDRRAAYDEELQRLDRDRQWEQEEQEWLEAEQSADWSRENNFRPPEYGTHGNPAAAIARLYTIVMFAVFVILAIAFAYAVVRSGSVGMEPPGPP